MWTIDSHEVRSASSTEAARTEPESTVAATVRLPGAAVASLPTPTPATPASAAATINPQRPIAAAPPGSRAAGPRRRRSAPWRIGSSTYFHESAAIDEGRGELEQGPQQVGRRARRRGW